LQASIGKQVSRLAKTSCTHAEWKDRAPTWGLQRERSVASTRDGRGHTYTSCRTHNYLQHWHAMTAEITHTCAVIHARSLYCCRHTHAVTLQIELANLRRPQSQSLSAFLPEHATAQTYCYALGSPCLAGRSCREKTGTCCHIGKRHSCGTCTESCACSSAHAGLMVCGISVRGLKVGEGVGCRCQAKTHLSVILPDSNVCFRSQAQNLPRANVTRLPDALPEEPQLKAQYRRATQLVPGSAKFTTPSLHSRDEESHQCH